MDAELGNNPSFVWRSLLAARDIIYAGSRWEIGDGRKIRVATHNWLPHSPVFINAPPVNMTVHDLMNEESKQWDRGKLFATFDRHTCETILNMPLNHQATQDRLVWMENKAHTFTVSSAYQVALRLQ